MVEKWKELNRRMLFESHGRGIVVIKYRLPDDRVEDFNVKHERDFVRIFGLTADKKIITVKKFVAGPGQVVVDLPAGYIRPGEGVLEAAIRELRDETGYQWSHLVTTIKTFSDGYTDVNGYVVVATGCYKILKEPPEVKTEFLEVGLLRVSEVRWEVKRGADFSSDIQAWYLGLDHLGFL
jgi:ADP-ribose pyrophosphatase